MTSKYAVPLAAVVGAAQVPLSEQVESVDEPRHDWVPEVQFPALPMGPDGAGADGD
jgi:hypothetical protein